VFDKKTRRLYQVAIYYDDVRIEELTNGNKYY